jgi:pimeloyl-ACP methyl ester carboxylesterase
MVFLFSLAAAIGLGSLATWAASAHFSRSIAALHPPTGEFADAGGVRLHYHLTGPEDAPAVLVLHGASGNLHEPKLALSEALSGYRVLWLDRPGLGWSERPQGGGDWTPEREAALIADLLTALEIEDVHVIGHSWGAAIAARLMMDHPGRARGGVLVAPALRAHVGDAAFYNHLTGWPVLGDVITRAVVPALGPGALESGVESAFAPAQPPGGYVAATRLKLLLRPSAWRANAADMARVNISLEEQEVRYHEITQPVIIVAAEADTVVYTQRHSVPFVETIQNGELRLIEGEGHNPHHGHAGAIAQALADVVAR